MKNYQIYDISILYGRPNVHYAVQTKKVDVNFALLTVGLNLDLSLFFELVGRTYIDIFKLGRFFWLKGDFDFSSCYKREEVR